MKNTIDWGDDYAQYILQAKGICLHSFSLMMNVSGLEQYSPQFRPLGFPLLLTPFYAAYGNNTYILEVMNSALLILLCSIVFAFFKNYFSGVISFFLVLVFAYNPTLLGLKQQVMPEIFFTFILYFAFLIYSKKDKYYYLKTAFLIACLLLVKYIGFALIVAYLAQLIFSNLSYYIKHKQFLLSKKALKNSVIIVLIPLLISYLVSDLVFKIPETSWTWYSKYFISKDMFSVLYANLLEYKDVFLSVFEQEVPHYINSLLKTSIFIFFIAGIVLKYKKRMELHDYFFVFYLLIILFYPYSKAGFRFLLPIFPLFLLYVTYGASAIIDFFFSKWKICIPLYLGMLLISYSINIKTLIIQTPAEQVGPEDKYFAECKTYIQKTTSLKDCFLFIKPWAFNLFTDRKVIPFDGHTSVKDFNASIINFDVKYVLACTNSTYELYDDNLLNLINTNHNFTRVWSNSVFDLYRINEVREIQKQ